MSEQHAAVKRSALVVGALGVVYGDIGTSPLYAFREAFIEEAHVLTVDRINVYGAVSYTHLRAHETVLDLVCRLLLEKKKQTQPTRTTTSTQSPLTIIRIQTIQRDS